MNVHFQTVLASVAASAVAGATVAAGFVNLQDTTPGTPQTGHINVTGTVRAGNLGLGAAPGANRAQVTATGTTGGLRIDTATGTGVSSTSNVTGGNFVARLTGGRAVVADAQASTGVAFGGVFAARTTGNGAGAYARAIGANNIGTGLIAENTSSSGNALVARNTGNNNSIEAGTATDSIVTNGTIPRHNYGATISSMVPIAYGLITSNGAPFTGTGNFTVTKAGTGKYDVDVAGVATGTSIVAVVATSLEPAGNELCTVTIAATGDFRLQVYNVTSNAFVDSDHYFVVFKATGLLEPPAGLARPDMGSAKDLGDWQRRDPAAFDRYRRAFQAWEREALATQPAALPAAP